MQWRDVTVSGLVVALVGFVLTRFTVVGVARDSTVEFLFSGMVPLVLGLGLSAAGVLLAVGAYDRPLVRRIAVWCLVGTGTMTVLVVLTLLGSAQSPAGMGEINQQTHLSTFLIGGAVGGALTGLYEGRNRQYRRDLREQANRLVVLNRLLRDRVVNSATAIRAHQEILQREYSEQSVEVVGSKVDDIVETVDQVGHLAETDDEGHGPVDLVGCVRRQVATVQESRDDAEFTVDAPDSAAVRATDQLGLAVNHLLVNAAVHSDSEQPQVAVSVETEGGSVRLRVSDDGPGLPESQQALLEDGEIAEYDDPTTGFGLNVVRLFAERFDGHLTTDVDDGTTVELRLPRAVEADDSSHRPAPGNGVAPSRAAVAIGAALVAGLTMAGAMAVLDGDLVAIGELYGIESSVVSLVTHEFHSVVFGLIYGGVLAVVRVASVQRRLAVGVGLGLSLWLVAAGLVMPLWLDLVGIGVPFPNLTVPSLAGHLTWGTTTGLCYHAGDRLLAGTDLTDSVVSVSGDSQSTTGAEN
jgi:two-component system OmpR family sensor kinase